MPTRRTALLGRHLGQTAEADGPTDGQLLGRFVTRRDHAAFAEIVRRHGPLVLGVCRRMLGPPDAEDAFQATFLVLARKAATVRPRERVASWLYGVAYRAAAKARTANARRRARECPVAEVPEPVAPPPDESWADVRPLIDRELNALPDRYRLPIVLCDLEGKGHQEAARQLGWPQGTLSGRLTRARRLLAGRLSRRGVTLSAGALAALPAAVPVALATSTVESSVLFASGRSAGAASGPAAALAGGVLQAMLLTKLKHLAVVVILAAFACYGAGVLLSPAPAAGQAADPKGPVAKDAKAKDKQPRAKEKKPAEVASGVLDIYELFEASKTNEALLDEKLVGKRLTVKGVMLRVKRSGEDANGRVHYALTLAATRATDPFSVNPGTTLSFDFTDEARAELAKLQSGQLVTVEGVGDSYRSQEPRGNPLGHVNEVTVYFRGDCKIKAVENPPPATVTEPKGGS